MNLVAWTAAIVAAMLLASWLGRRLGRSRATHTRAPAPALSTAAERAAYDAGWRDACTQMVLEINWWQEFGKLTANWAASSRAITRSVLRVVELEPTTRTKVRSLVDADRIQAAVLAYGAECYRNESVQKRAAALQRVMDLVLAETKAGVA